MYRAAALSVPSESTIEQLSNHQLLSIIGPYNTWFYVPTRNEERRLGYDASLQGQKILVIQYKRFRPGKKAGTGSIGLSRRQHRRLTSNFPPAGTPYVFYGFCPYATYDEIDRRFSGGAGFLFGLDMLFVDAHSLATTATSVSLPLIRAGTVRGWPLIHVATKFLSCAFGLRDTMVNEFAIRGDDYIRGPLPHLHILRWKMPVNAV